MRDEGDEDRTPADRPTVATAENRPLVMVLGHHALVLEETRKRVVELRDSIAAAVTVAPAGELREIGKAFRREADSAAAVAQAAEKAAG